jgi:hypothetical protein
VYIHCPVALFVTDLEKPVVRFRDMPRAGEWTWFLQKSYRIGLTQDLYDHVPKRRGIDVELEPYKN